MQLEYGKRYRLRSGAETGSLVPNRKGSYQDTHPFRCPEMLLTSHPNGHYLDYVAESPWDIVAPIAELAPEPDPIVFNRTPSARPPVIGRGKLVAFDVDDTLIQRLPHDGFRHIAEDDRFEIRGVWYRIRRDEVYRLRSFAGSNGFEVVVWSAGGAEWAAQVGSILGLDPLVAAYMSKPDFAVDDRSDFGITKDRWIPAYTTTDARRYIAGVGEGDAA